MTVVNEIGLSKKTVYRQSLADICIFGELRRLGRIWISRCCDGAVVRRLKPRFVLLYNSFKFLSLSSCQWLESQGVG
jgi:hypothetical protein